MAKRCVLAETASEGIRGVSKFERLVVTWSFPSSGQSKALKTEGLLSSKKVWDGTAGAVL